MAERKYRHPQVNLRMSEELKEKIAKLAAQHGRSANAEMVEAIETWVTFHNGIDMYGKRQPPLEKPITIQGDDMLRLLDTIKDAVVHQLVKKYKFAPKDIEDDKNP